MRRERQAAIFFGRGGQRLGPRPYARVSDNGGQPRTKQEGDDPDGDGGSETRRWNHTSYATPTRLQDRIDMLLTVRPCGGCENWLEQVL
ncbi:hypothetical protein CSOJ01_06710 [Colletotrichum sojae]|uniref:Uncharacterized protein n=1 Tax=Colletotrichum sojae TaxID=2175907 RepID=A0A8H6JBY8_9PEZI|nr:hypothetical protein CSOJ01_06710 [Colletotrichum sojae]